MNKEVIKALWKELDYWCEQYKLANQAKEQRFADAFKATGSLAKAEDAVKYDNEPTRISNNIKTLEKALHLLMSRI